MKIEASKNHSVERKESKNVFKTETSAFRTATPLKSAPSQPAPAQSTFAKILAETRHENGKDNAAAVKNDSADSDSTASRSEKDEKIARAADEQLEERDSRDGDGSPTGDENHSSPATPGSLPMAAGAAAESAPAARSILHVADLERIISTIRTETFRNQKRIVIALRNSVLQGLQIRLTIAENGRLKAEFLALNKQIKSQLEKRRKELSEILQNRSALFSEIEITSQE